MTSKQITFPSLIVYLVGTPIIAIFLSCFLIIFSSMIAFILEAFGIHVVFDNFYETTKQLFFLSIILGALAGIVLWEKQLRKDIVQLVKK